MYDPQLPIYEAEDPIDRVDGRAKVTGAAKYSAEYEIPNLVYGILVGSTIAKGKISSLDTKEAERAPGVLSVITHQNAPKVPAYQQAPNATTPPGPTWSNGLKILYSDKIYFYGQPVALVIADTLERAQQAASMVKAQYAKEEPKTDLHANLSASAAPRNARRSEEHTSELQSQS